MSDLSQLIPLLEAEYDLEHGFLGQLRQGVFDPAGLERLLTLVRAIDLAHADVVNRRVVALLWMIPTVMSWQLERVAEHRGDVERLRRGIDQMQALLSAASVLGTP
jgi:hypothetical protein